MKLVKIFLFVFIIATGVVFIIEKSHKREIESGELRNPDEPYEDFMLQRIYPGKTFDTHAYKAGLNQAINMSRNPAYRMKSNSVLDWTLEGPGNIGGRFNCLVVNELNHDVMYAGSANGGVWKTTDHANSWFPVFDSIPYLAIGAIAINPNDTGEIWVGTGDLNISGTMYLGNGLYKSSNSGLSWSYVGLADTYVISSIVFNNANPNEMLVATMGNSFARDNNRGIYKTTNGGQSFVNVNFVNDSTGFIDMQTDPVNSSIVYASSFTRLRTDWNSLTTGTEVYLYKSTDFGQTWNILTGGLPTGVSQERLGFTICKNFPNIIYALYSTSTNGTPELYKSTDAGSNWSQVIINQFDPNEYGSYGWYFGKIYCDPDQPNLIYIPGVNLQVSQDGGVTWSLVTQFTSLDVHADGHHLCFLSHDEFYYCTDGGIYHTTNAGFDWVDVENIPVNQFYSVTEDRINHGVYAGGVQDNGTMYGNASTMNSYERLFGGDGFTVAYSLNPKLIYAEYQYGAIVYNDSFPASNWNYIQTDFNQNYNWHTPYFLSPYSDDTMYFAGQSVMRIDGAPYSAFTIISPTLNDPSSPQRVSNISTLNQSKLSRGILYAGTADGKVWSTGNGGNVWNDITPFQGNPFYVTAVLSSPNDVNTVYVTRSGYRMNDNTPYIFKSINNGNNWTSVTGDLPLLGVNDIAVYPGNENIIFVANDAGVYFSINAGIHYGRLGGNMPFLAAMDIEFNYDNSKIIAGTFGRSIYTIDISSIITSVPSTDISRLINLYPSPALNEINFNSSVPIDQFKIYSMKGLLVKEGKGLSADVAQLAAGTYFVKLKCGEKETVLRFVKL